LLLASGDRVYRAGISTCAAIGALCGIDIKLIVALTDCFYRAGGFTGTAGNAFAGNYIGHIITPWLVNYFSRKLGQYTSKKLDYTNNSTS
jgi:hypothetical protein